MLRNVPVSDGSAEVGPLLDPAGDSKSRLHKLLGVGSTIDAIPPGSEDRSFLHSILCQVGLPRSKVTGEKFFRQSGAAWLSVQSGDLDLGHGPVAQCIPYGSMPRLMLACVSTYSVLNKTREIPIGNSPTEFLRYMGMPNEGRRHEKLQEQMHAFAACRMQLGFRGRTCGGQPVEQFDAWVAAEASAQQRALWPGVLVLSEWYFKALAENAVPLDRRALHALKGSPFALDVYVWLALRLYRIDGGPVTLSWSQLRGQFGQEFTGPDASDNFKKTFKRALGRALEVYRKAAVTVSKDGLLLSCSQPPIPRRGVF